MRSGSLLLLLLLLLPGCAALLRTAAAGEAGLCGLRYVGWQLTQNAIELMQSIRRINGIAAL